MPWAYIATTAGAPMSKTLALAEGTALFNGETTGIIHRSHYSGGRETPQITELEIGDELVLMYDFMDTGLVYPLARFEILDPNMPTNQTPLRNIGLRPQRYEGAPPLVVLQGGNLLQPDYIGNVDRGLNNDKEGRHLALIVRQLSAGPPEVAIGKIFRRDPTVTHNTILPWEAVENELVNEYDAEFKDTNERKEQLNSLVPVDISDELENKLDKLWGGSLDGRGKQLLINAIRLHKVSPGLVYNDFSNSTLSGYCLIALVEYEMLRLLKKKADIILNSSPDDEWSVDYLRLDTGNNHYTRLPLAPEGVDDKCNFSQLIHAIPFIARGQYGAELIRGSMGTTSWSEKWRNVSFPILRARNRIAHSYYLQKVHFDELWNLVCGKDGILKLLHG
ncbi:MAG: hypothetical protein JZU65_21195 [Chlorobium sp.]|nr:hypothetical protein [Chlorobium sp.]